MNENVFKVVKLGVGVGAIVLTLAQQFIQQVELDKHIEEIVQKQLNKQ